MNETNYLDLDEKIIKWHITDDGEVDFTTYEEYDGGRLGLPENPTKDQIEALLEESM